MNLQALSLAEIRFHRLAYRNPNNVSLTALTRSAKRTKAWAHPHFIGPYAGMSMGSQLLIVDDDPVTLQAVSLTIQHLLPAVTIETCGSPVSALVKLRSKSVAVVLSDYKMPDMNSLGLLRAARDGGSIASFLLMTGDSTEDMLREGLRLGLFALVNKPLNRSVLIPLVQQAIECHRLRQEVAELRRTLRESGVEWGCFIRGPVPAAEEVFQPLLPY